MSEPKLSDRFATPNSSKLAQILLDLRGVEGQQGLCNLQPSEVTLWPVAFNAVATQADAQTPQESAGQDTCNCRKSRCLKLYCQCFAAKATCGASCRCLSCENRPDNAAVRDVAVSLILERNPNAFDSKYRPAAPVMLSNTFTAVTSIAHKNGCRCRKSMCLKKYCECFQGGVACSAICTCLTCQNTTPHTSLLGSYAGSAAVEKPPAASSAEGLTPSLASVVGSGNYRAAVDVTAAAATSASGSALGRPPLVPSNKRKRESHRGPDTDEVGTSRGDGEDSVTKEATSVSQQDSKRAATTDQVLASPATLTRAQQQQLLEQLLYQELESQGLLSSPFASFVNNNCAGLLQGQGAAMGDLLALVGSQLQSSAVPSVKAANDGGAASSTPVLGTPAAAAGKPLAAPTAPAAATALGVLTASPNSISIATALALLAANAQARAAAQQLPTVVASTLPGGVSLTTPRMKPSLLAPSRALGSAVEQCAHGSTPTTQILTSRSGATESDCTDGELTGTESGDRLRGCSPGDGLAEKEGLESLLAQRKDLFGSAEFTLSPDSVHSASTDRATSIDSVRRGTEKKSLASEACRTELDGSAKENCPPNLLAASGVTVLQQ